MATVGTVRIYRPDPALADELQRCGRATFTVRRRSATRVAIAVIGDVDATNGRALGHYVERHTGISRQLVLDLRAVDFFGGQAFTALYYISVHCTRSDVDWVIVAGAPVRRLLSICDPDGELPIVDDLPSALARLDRHAQCHQHVAPAAG
jgi:anti-anti-sigma factor